MIKKILIISGFFSPVFLTGCFSEKKTELKPKVLIKNEISKASVFNAQLLYKDSKLTESLLEIEKVLKNYPNDGEALFLKSLVYFKSSNYKKTSEILSILTNKQKLELAESCIELQALNNSKTNLEVIKIAKFFFPDCLDDLIQKKYLSDPLIKFNKQEILRFGKLYDQAIAKSDDEDKKRQIEEAFIKKYKLTNEELNHITSNYLEVLANEL
ncbi:MAG: hypothetical protein COB02_07165 [Candidatus Cloacimonadota bacterium]|nr:MAG: hypothetical protein COB02_07165 [Candidatus Cloacimonadota bacterium]